MPLYDSLGKKVAKSGGSQASRTKHYGTVPTVDDLLEGLLIAQEKLRQPVILTWRRDQSGPMFLLTVIRNSPGYEPTWILNEDDSNKITVHWSYITADPELIHGLISEKLLESGPAAVIPEALRPKNPRATGSRMKSVSKEPANAGEPQFFENYEIMNTIGKGGMGIIYKAKDRNDGNLVALKVLRTELMVEKVNVDRFKREASAVHALKHPNLVAVKEFGFSRFGQPFIAMDYLEGVELKALLAERKQLDLPVFVNIFTQLCNALAYAHDQGLVHRDIKPGNIMLVKNEGGQDVVKIIDFGIAKSVHEQSAQPSTDTPSYTTTTGGAFVGSPGYMSPEQCAGATLDKRSDIYSLGCVMYESITGSIPFKHDNVLKTILAHVNEPPPFFAMVRPDLNIPEELEHIVRRCLEKNPDDRYQNARELCDALWEFAATNTGAAEAKAAPHGQSGQAPPVQPAQQGGPPPMPPQVQRQGPPPLPPQAPLSAPAQSAHPGQQPNPQPPQGPPQGMYREPYQSAEMRSLPLPQPQQQLQQHSAQQQQSNPNLPAQQGDNQRPAFTSQRSKPNEPSVMSEKTFMLLHKAGLLTDELLAVAANCEDLVDRGEITVQQAVAIIRQKMAKKAP